MNEGVDMAKIPRTREQQMRHDMYEAIILLFGLVCLICEFVYFLTIKGL